MAVFSRKSGERKTRIFFVTDVHGSDRCFRKFLNASKFYSARFLVLGGDITGKVMIPIVETSSGKWSADYLGETKKFENQEKLQEFEKLLGDSGIYPMRMTQSEYEEARVSEAKIRELFNKAMKNSLEKWMNLAGERLGGTDTKCFISVGNDDDPIVDEVLKTQTCESVVFCEEDIVKLDDYEMLSLGTSNRTPWNSPREADEEGLGKKMETLVSKLENASNSIFSVHVPPIASGIDAAPKIDKEFKPVMSGGHPMMISAGSKAVRDSIERYQPVLGLHGHIHESRGVYKLGKTICINPGSEYGQGILRGAIVDLAKNSVSDYLLVAG